MDKLKDKCGKEINAGCHVELPDPTSDDIYSYSFVGRVDNILKEKGTVIVEDQESECFEIEANRVEVVMA